MCSLGFTLPSLASIASARALRSSTICLPNLPISAFCPLPSAPCPLPSTLYPLPAPSASCPPPSAFRSPPSAIRHPPSAIRHPPSARRPLPSALRPLPLRAPSEQRSHGLRPHPPPRPRAECVRAAARALPRPTRGPPEVGAGGRPGPSLSRSEPSHGTFGVCCAMCAASTPAGGPLEA